MMQKADDWNDQISFYRYWQNDRVTEENLTEICISHCMEQCHGKFHLLLLEDTTELNLERHRGRITDRAGLGVTGNDHDLGFFCHPTIAVDASDNSLAGALDIHLWCRPEGKAGKRERAYSRQPLEDKESYRWAERAIVAGGRLPEGVRKTVVQDREGDIYESFCLLSRAGLDFVVRSHHDRRVEGDISRLSEQLSCMSVSQEYELEILESKARKSRMAQMEVRYGRVRLRRPSGTVHAECYPPSLDVYVVQVREKAGSVPSGEKPVEWILYTSHLVADAQDALAIVGYYTKRWIIEELFRTLKSEGVNYESSELESGPALRKLFIMAFLAAIKILQMRQARSGETSQPASLVFSPEQTACMEDLQIRFEGKTEKQKNPFKKDTLAWAAWTIARLGGWKGYASQRPPGVITFYDGYSRFQGIFDGWMMAKVVYKR
ncbi:MAG: IS4 family transposase [Mediterranea sp.]|jgi:hypothetical protein|nr:IS4 family transposase [Mediterranea sp.]